MFYFSCCFNNQFYSKITPTKLILCFWILWCCLILSKQKTRQGYYPGGSNNFSCVLNVGTVVEGKQCGFPLHWIHVDGWTGREDKRTQCPMKHWKKRLLPEENETRSSSQRNRYSENLSSRNGQQKGCFTTKLRQFRFSVRVGVAKKKMSSQIDRNHQGWQRMKIQRFSRELFWGNY